MRKEHRRTPGEKIELRVNLDQCIETAARREYDNLVRTYFQTGRVEEEFASRIELLREFLESADFKALRAESEKHLLDGKEVRFVLYREQGGVRCDLIVGN
jgi:hypothetical protein